jgi:hypothetical protein
MGARIVFCMGRGQWCSPQMGQGPEKGTTMIKRSKKVAPAAVETPVVETAPVAAPQHPILAVPSTTVQSAPAKQSKRYVAKFWQPDWVITVLRPNPKRGQCAERYALHVPGQTVAEYTALVVQRGKNGAKGETAALANLDLRWGMARGFYSIDPPAPKQEG